MVRLHDVISKRQQNHCKIQTHDQQQGLYEALPSPILPPPTNLRDVGGVDLAQDVPIDAGEELVLLHLLGAAARAQAIVLIAAQTHYDVDRARVQPGV